eukprot:11247327-Ditylum_brightwellii.AAC.1
MGLTDEKVDRQVLEGWLGKPKGMKQIAFEQGLIDPEVLKFYSKADIVEEQTLLQTMSKDIGLILGMKVIVDRSSKGHPEIAGEGVKYKWAN